MNIHSMNLLKFPVTSFHSDIFYSWEFNFLCKIGNCKCAHTCESSKLHLLARRDWITDFLTNCQSKFKICLKFHVILKFKSRVNPRMLLLCLHFASPKFSLQKKIELNQKPQLKLSKFKFCFWKAKLFYSASKTMKPFKVLRNERLQKTLRFI